MAARLEGQVVLIVGAGRGIGRTLALAFAAEGASLALAARTLREVEVTAAACRERGVNTMAARVDIDNWPEVEALVAAMLERFGRLDCVVDCAAVHGPIGPTAEADPGAWAAAVQTDLVGAFHVLRAALPSFIAQGRGSAVLLSGGGATLPVPGISAYAAAKAGLVRLVETVAAEVQPFGVRVNAIAPGLVDTTLQDDVLAAGPRAGALYEEARAARETGAGAVPPELAAELAVFLASDASAPLTGKLISAPHDPWRSWETRGAALNASPWYTLRRLDPHTLGPLRDSQP